ncbi:MAG TPA: FtsX-like permease family protein [Burkholderiales bacterium]|nr:FtsX-like permease family protein [Burkholderiales bacterium]
MRRPLPLLLVLAMAARNLARNKVRSALALAAIASGVAGLLLSGGFVNDLIFQLGEALIHSQSGHLQVARTGYFEFGSRAPAKYLIAPEEVDRIGLQTVSHVVDVMRRINFSALLNNGRSSYPVLGEGIEPDNETRLGTHVTLLEGATLSAKDRSGALVGAGLARAMNLKPGSVISLLAPTIDEAMNSVDLEVVGIFQSFSADYDNRVIKLPLTAAQDLLNTNGVNVLVMQLDHTENTQRAAKAIAGRAAKLGLEVLTWDRLNDFYWKAVALYDRQFGVLRLVVLIMVLLAVIGAINISVAERTGEFGTMRALGNSGADVMRLVLVEGVLMGVAGAVAGVLLGLAAASLISRIGIPMPPPPNSNLDYIGHIRVDVIDCSSAFAIGIGATVLASIAPAFRVRRLPIVDALRRMV